MTDYFFHHTLVKLHYYKFGSGEKAMLCFHGYGMHGKQFSMLESFLGEQYTFYGFDLFFHKETKLVDQSLSAVKAGISKSQLARLIEDFCSSEQIDQFSVLAYSMGTHYGTALVEQIPERIEAFIAAAPSSLRPGVAITFLSTNKIGNKLLEKLALSESAMLNMLNFCRSVGIVDDKGREILHREIGTYELRFSFYACATYLRLLKTNFKNLIDHINTHQIKTIFFFGKRDSMYQEKNSRHLIAKLNGAQTVILDENHDMIKRSFAEMLTRYLQ